MKTIVLKDELERRDGYWIRRTLTQTGCQLIQTVRLATAVDLAQFGVG